MHRFCGFPLLFLFPLFLIGQSKKTDCSTIKKGTFYYFPPSSSDRYIIIRSDSIQQEITLIKHDTSFWRIDWQNNCTCSMKFIRKNKILPNEEREFYNSHKAVCAILDVTKDYYTFKSGLDSVSANSPIDTLWINSRRSHWQ